MDIYSLGRNAASRGFLDSENARHLTARQTFFVLFVLRVTPNIALTHTSLALLQISIKKRSKKRKKDKTVVSLLSPSVGRERCRGVSGWQQSVLNGIPMSGELRSNPGLFPRYNRRPWSTFHSSNFRQNGGALSVGLGCWTVLCSQQHRSTRRSPFQSASLMFES